MAWVDCMRLRRVASVVRGVGWSVSALIFVFAAGAAFLVEGDHGLVPFAVIAAASAAILAVTYAIAWALDRRGERLVTR